ncbi:MAG: hypothetical protein CO161_02860 [Candidatus Portnoybacteria bacterium CG_4_9_14_3_um_filter_44_9]|uniref:Uncharacterized protein n=1 Tax=Candidatus Portnoybacteria bacterium CG_4_9_14_3_um_filter_44_9 TaxID=1974806 RepID=A0A2M7YJE2_9BACT|nr:MAG: hypothetical protein CO161_02860 [Candidatus Portnoybacteria bacterium CG_4_9_14_3_um_filter_44_9]
MFIGIKIRLNYNIKRSILELVRTPVVKQSLLRGTAHFAACGGEPACRQGREVPSRKFGKAAEPHR